MAPTFDILIIGGGPAGLSAALYAARACLTVALCSSGPSRNAPTSHTHGLLTQDGRTPQQLLDAARADLAQYPLITSPHAVVTLTGHDGAFTATLDNGTTLTTRKLILTTGVTDVLPDIPGVQDAWGKTVHHCPVCHGYELRHDHVALLEPNLTSAQLPGVLSHYRSTATTLLICTQGPAALTSRERALLSAQGVELDERPLQCVEPFHGVLRLHFDTSTSVDRAALFIHTKRVPNTQLGEQLGGQLAPHGLFIPEPSSHATTVSGVYAAGDVSGGNQVVFALASGARAAMYASAALHHERAVTLLGA